ncbi:hypothetical protein [Ornithinimicrobium kibberense]|uniref:hypothetical protein n=1 Tax=Ornithinimicrobium kibberense TaxID=282060 RepID=UPI00360D20FC
MVVRPGAEVVPRVRPARPALGAPAVLVVGAAAHRAGPVVRGLLVGGGGVLGQRPVEDEHRLGQGRRAVGEGLGLLGLELVGLGLVGLGRVGLGLGGLARGGLLPVGRLGQAVRRRGDGRGRRHVQLQGRTALARSMRAARSAGSGV